jgi:hypothetical protein
VLEADDDLACSSTLVVQSTSYYYCTDRSMIYHPAGTWLGCVKSPVGKAHGRDDRFEVLL